jgi:hypothetical protein
MAAAGLRIRGLALRRPWADVRDPEVLAEVNRDNSPFELGD